MQLQLLCSRSIASVAVLTFGVMSCASAVEYTRVNPTASQISFTYNQMGTRMYGTFGKFQATLDFDTDKPEAARVKLDIDMASIDAGSDDANSEMPKPAWFNTADFPLGTFESTRVKDLGNNKYLVTGNLTIRGITRQVEVPVVLSPDNEIGLFNGELVLKRDDFEVGKGEWADTVVSKDIDIKFRVVAPQR